MKIILIGIVLLSSLQYAFADTTLIYSDQLIAKSKPTVTYSIKDNRLKLVESGQNKVNVYNRKTEEFVSYEASSGKRSLLNKDILNKRTKQLNKDRLKTVVEVEKKLQKDLPNMTPAQQETAETLINLYRYPEFYGEHTSLIVRKLKSTKQVNGIECQPYQLYKITNLLKTFCFANAESLKMSEEEYQTLRSFYAFNYTMQSQILIALGDTKFSIIDYDQHAMPGVIIEEIAYEKSKIIQHSILKHFNNQAIQNADFSIKPSPD